MKKMFNMVEAVYKARPAKPIIVHLSDGQKIGKCSHCSMESVLLLMSRANYCFNCGQRLK